MTVNIMNFLLLARLFNSTGSSIATSLLWVSYALPAIFFGPIGAGIVDLFDRRKILIFSNLIQALIVFMYIFSHSYSIFLLFAVVTGYSFMNQFYVPAESAALPSVVNKKVLAKANSIFFITQQLAVLIGFGFAGILEKLIGFKGSLILCSIFLFMATTSVYFLPKLTVTSKVKIDWENVLNNLFSHILDGYRFIKHNGNILYPLGLLFVIQAGLAVITANLPQFAKEIFSVSSNYIGLLVVVPAGIGALFGSIFLNKVALNKIRKKKIIETGLLLLALSLLVLILAPIYFSSIAVLILGVGFAFINITTITYLQQVTPLFLRGRVFGNLWFLVTIASILPVIFSGVVSEFFGTKTLLTIIALGAILILSCSITKGQKFIEEKF